MTYWGFDSAFDRAIEAAGLTDVRSHDIRRTAGCDLLNATGKIMLVKQLLGHSSVVTTERSYGFVKRKAQLLGMLAAESASSAQNSAHKSDFDA